MSDPHENPSFDEMLDALADVQRRTLLLDLLEHNPQTVKLAIDAEEAEEAVFDRLVAMKHIHLPKLAEYGFIEWDREHDEVIKGPAFDEIRPLVELLDTHRDEFPADWL